MSEFCPFPELCTGVAGIRCLAGLMPGSQHQRLSRAIQSRHARELLGRLIRREFPSAGAGWAVVHDHDGRPRLIFGQAHGPPLSLAHSGICASCALGPPQFELGIDVERWSGRDWDRLAPQFCRPAELDMLAGAAPAARAALAAAIWCLREALFKAGAGAAAIDLLPALCPRDGPRADNPAAIRLAAGWSAATAVHGEYCHALVWREAAAEPAGPPA